GGMVVIDTEQNIIAEGKSKVSKHNENSVSVRAVIPKNIADLLNVKDGDFVYWKGLTKNDIPFVIVNKFE
ncbi:MAG: hypothetical protein ACRCVG_04425, partial [Methanobacteriaceae archaeon]